MLIPLAKLVWAFVTLAWKWLLRWPFVLLLRWQRARRVAAKIGKFFVTRFEGTSDAEKWGYAVWLAMGVAVGTPEIAAAIGGDSFPWRTISSTVGHREDLNPGVGLLTVAALVFAAFGVVRYPTTQSSQLLTTPPPEGTASGPDLVAVARGPYGRLERGEPDLSRTDEQIVTVKQADRPIIPVDWYFTIASIGISAAGFAAAQAQNRWLIGYVIYPLIAAFWIVIPATLSYVFRADVPVLTLFLTLRALTNRLAFVAYFLAIGLGILFVHLTFYPWPDLLRQHAKFADITPGHAQKKAEDFLSKTRKGAGLDGLETLTDDRDVINGREVWHVYFQTHDHTPTDCVVTITGPDQTPQLSPPCSKEAPIP